jgi:hypothetical protein
MVNCKRCNGTGEEPMWTNDTPSREEMIENIYDVIWGSEFYDQYWMSGHTLYIIHIWDVLDWIAKTHWERNITILGNGVVSFWDWQWEVKMREPIDNQSDNFITWLHSLIETTETI